MYFFHVHVTISLVLMRNGEILSSFLSFIFVFTPFLLLLSQYLLDLKYCTILSPKVLLCHSLSFISLWSPCSKFNHRQGHGFLDERVHTTHYFRKGRHKRKIFKNRISKWKKTLIFCMLANVLKFFCFILIRTIVVYLILHDK